MSRIHGSMQPSQGPSGDLLDWIVRAEEVCREASRGNMEARILHIESGPDELRGLLRGINHMLDMTDAFVREATASLQCASEGRFFRRVLPNGMLGSFRVASRSINDATRQMDVKTQELDQAERRRRQMGEDFRKTVEVVEGLAQASQQIAGFSKVIKSIADQTNLLALNAAIEAARCGEAGKGFAVVADEVKRLSQQATEATRSIEAQLESIERATEATVASIEMVRATLAGDEPEDNETVPHTPVSMGADG